MFKTATCGLCGVDYETTSDDYTKCCEKCEKRTFEIGAKLTPNFDMMVSGIKSIYEDMFGEIVDAKGEYIQRIHTVTAIEQATYPKVYILDNNYTMPFTSYNLKGV